MVVQIIDKQEILKECINKIYLEVFNIKILIFMALINIININQILFLMGILELQLINNFLILIKRLKDMKVYY